MTDDTERHRRVAWPIYGFAISIAVSLVLVAFIFWQDRDHDRALARLSLIRQQESNEFFRAVCDRFEIRDEIFLSVLQDAYGRSLARGDKVAAETLQRSIIALREAQGNCANQIPKVRKPPAPPP